MHAISSYRGNRPTNTHTNRQERLQYTVPQLSRSVINKEKEKTYNADSQDGHEKNKGSDGSEQRNQSSAVHVMMLFSL